MASGAVATSLPGFPSASTASGGRGRSPICQAKNPPEGFGLAVVVVVSGDQVDLSGEGHSVVYGRDYQHRIISDIPGPLRYNGAMANTQSPPRGPQLKLAGALCVAFVNTAGVREQNRQLGFGNYRELLVWGQQADLLSPLEAKCLSRRAAERPKEAAAILTRAVELRSRLFRLFLATGRRDPPPPDDFAAVNEALARALPALRMVPADGGVQWGWAGDENALDRMLWPVLLSAAELMIAARGQPHVRQCMFKGCLLFFVDRGPRGQRRWCDMRTCGNRAKSRRYYKRNKAWL